jgi:hypothetical protein
MRRVSSAALAAFTIWALGGSAFASAGAQHLWSGIWRTSTGKLAWRSMSESEIESAKTEPDHAALYDKLRCKSSPTFYRGGYTGGSDSGKVLACGTASQLWGRWLSDTQPGNAGSYAIHISSLQPLEFEGTATPDGGKPFTWTGTWISHFAGDGGSETVPTRLTFRVLVKGRPNLCTDSTSSAACGKAAPNPPGLVGSRLSGGGFVSFAGRPDANGLLKPVDPLSVSIVQEDTYADGTTKQLQLGIIKEASAYSPRNNRLGLALKVKQSNDPACPASTLREIRAASLVLIPVGGVRDAAVFAGIQASRTIIKNPLSSELINLDVKLTPCRGHFHAWQNAAGVTVRVVLDER